MSTPRSLFALRMIPLLGCILLSGAAAAQTTSANEWTWMGGSDTVGSSGLIPGVYGTQGAAAPGNMPGSRVDAVSWTDGSGRFWLFGGLYPTTPLQYLNDLWMFNPTTSEWTWMGGSSNASCTATVGCGASGVYGTLQSPAAANMPGGREEAMSWTDNQGNFWLYGGDGFDSIGQLGVLNDLWEFNPTTGQWTWMGGNNTVPGNGYGRGGVYGTQGVFAAANNPGALMMANVWIDRSGNAWLFGGWGSDADGLNGLPNNLWELRPSTNEWAWMGGNSTFGSANPWYIPSLYGTLATPAPGNTPGSRWQAASWTDSNGNLWLFGGQGYDSKGNSGYLNELWEFNTSTSEWAWMGGSQILNCTQYGQGYCDQPGVYGTLGTAASGNLPGSRAGGNYWTDSGGRFWLFGGYGFDAKGVWSSLNDLWEFNPSTKEWAWMGGDSAGNGGGIYGALGVPSPGNLPGGRHGASGWTDSVGNFWLFAGNALDANDMIGLPNDLWVYEPSNTTNLPAPGFTVSGTAVTVTAGATTGNISTITLTPLGGFTGSVALTAAITSSPAGAASIPNLNFGATTPVPTAGVVGTASLTILTTAGQGPVCISATQTPGGGPWYVGGGAVLACMLLLGIPAQRRDWRAMLGFAFLSLTLAAGAVSCGGGGGTEKACGTAIVAGTTPGAYVITVTATSGTIAQTGTVALTVQ